MICSKRARFRNETPDHTLRLQSDVLAVNNVCAVTCELKDDIVEVGVDTKIATAATYAWCSAYVMHIKPPFHSTPHKALHVNSSSKLHPLLSNTVKSSRNQIGLVEYSIVAVPYGSCSSHEYLISVQQS